MKHMWKFLLLIPVLLFLVYWGCNLVAEHPNMPLGEAVGQAIGGMIVILWLAFISLLPTALIIALIYRLFKGF